MVVEAKGDGPQSSLQDQLLAVGTTACFIKSSFVRLPFFRHWNRPPSQIATDGNLTWDMSESVQCKGWARECLWVSCLYLQVISILGEKISTLSTYISLSQKVTGVTSAVRKVRSTRKLTPLGAALKNLPVWIGLQSPESPHLQMR